MKKNRLLVALVLMGDVVLSPVAYSQAEVPAQIDNGVQSQPPKAPDYGSKARSKDDGGMEYLVGGKSVAKKRYDSAALANEGLLLLRANKNEQAIDKLKQSVGLTPDLPEPHHSLGIALAKSGRFAEAVSEMKQVVSLNPTSESAWLTLAGFCHANGDLDGAMGSYQEFIQRFPKSLQKKRVDAAMSVVGREIRARDIAVPDSDKAPL